MNSQVTLGEGFVEQQNLDGISLFRVRDRVFVEPEKRCFRCGKKNDRLHLFGKRLAQSYCSACHASYMRRWRKTHHMSAEQHRRDNARSYLNVYVKRGKIVRASECGRCGSPRKVQAHHHDYSKPLQVEWLCLVCHMREHYAKELAQESLELGG